MRDFIRVHGTKLALAIGGCMGYFVASDWLGGLACVISSCVPAV